jgi:hypothetical protein
MKALSIRQPWAWLIVHGVKDVENRTWRTNFRGRFLVHAGMRFDEDGHRRIWAEAHASKALALYLTGHSKEAISAFEHAITLDPEQFGSHLFMVCIAGVLANSTRRRRTWRGPRSFLLVTRSRCVFLPQLPCGPCSASCRDGPEGSPAIPVGTNLQDVGRGEHGEIGLCPLASSSGAEQSRIFG